MRRELTKLVKVCYCCPGHDKYPTEKYSSNRSTRARARDKKTEHQVVRRIQRRRLDKELTELSVQET